MSDDLIKSMRSRIAKCHRLADGIFDDRTKKALRDMAAEIERDVLRLEAERNAQPNDPTPPLGLTSA